MKVAHVNLIYGTSKGVEQKLTEKAQVADSLGIDIDFYILNLVKQERLGGVNYVRLKTRKFPLNIYDRLFSRYGLIDRTVDLLPYDYIILRYPLADKSGVRFVKKFNVITEHHTDELSERLAKLRFKTSLKQKIISLLFYLQEKRYGKSMLQNCKGLISVTKEIENRLLTKTNCDVPSVVIPNGINVQKITQTGFKQFDGKQLDIVVLTAGSFSVWLGVDRLLKSLSAYKGSVKIMLHIVGHIDHGLLSNTSCSFSNIKLYGIKTGTELNDIMKNMHVAVGTLTLFRNNMQEACSLKTREYTARGIPFVLAHKDADLSGVDSNFQFCLYYPNDGSLLDIDKLIDFVNRANKLPDLSKYMRNYALRNMDLRIKLDEYKHFIKKISNINWPHKLNSYIKH